MAIQGAADKPNLTVTGLSLARSTFSNQERVTVTAVIANRSQAAPRVWQHHRARNGRPAGRQQAAERRGGRLRVGDVRPGHHQLEELQGHGAAGRRCPGGRQRVQLRGVPVRAGAADDRRSRERGPLSTRALSIGEAPRFETVSRQVDAVSDEDLRRSAVVVLNDVSVSTGLARRLSSYVEQGGGLFVGAGPRATWPQEVDLLPATIGNPVDRTRGDAARVGSAQFAHPVFEPFRAPRSGDFSRCRSTVIAR